MRKPGASISSLMPRRSAAATQTTRSTLCSAVSVDQRLTMWRSSCGGSVSRRRVVDAVVIEEHALDLVPLGQRGLGELVGRVGGLVRVRAFADQHAEFHGVGDQKRMWVEAFRLAREPRQSSIRYLVNGRSVFSKKRGQPMRSTQSDDALPRARVVLVGVQDLLHHGRHLGPARRIVGQARRHHLHEGRLAARVRILAAHPDRQLASAPDR